jgi:hypothetical protein
MECLVILKNPVPQLGSRTIRMVMALGRISLFFEKMNIEHRTSNIEC